MPSVPLPPVTPVIALEVGSAPRGGCVVGTASSSGLSCHRVQEEVTLLQWTFPASFGVRAVLEGGGPLSNGAWGGLG